MRLIPILTLLLAALAPGGALAHEVGARAATSLTPLFEEWAWNAATSIPMAIAFFWYATGLWRTIAEGKAGTIAPSRLVAFACGMIVLVIALQSPIDTISEDLFSVHMVQHLLLMLAAPPLFVWSDCPLVFLRALPRNTRKAVARYWAGSGLSVACHTLMHPLLVWALFCGAFVFWHAPGPYQWALHDNRVHISEHLSFFVSSLAFWSLVLPPHGYRRRLQHGPTLLLVVATAVLSGLPGALMIFSPRPLYPAHAEGVARWGLTLLQDQQLAGLIMWIPAGGAYVLAVALVFLRWLKDAEARALRAAGQGIPTLAIVAAAVFLLGGCDQKDTALVNFSGDAKRGALLIDKYGCGNCHEIPDLGNAKGNVGPPLAHVGTRTYLAGFVRNSPENMTLWIEDPQRILPGNVMPSMEISHKDARDITAFLYTLK
jgi:cytochrome c oxidase assembly factor CtaG/cytochrome c2